MKNKLRRKIKDFVDYILQEPNKEKDWTEFNPKKSRKLKAFSVVSKEPLGDSKYNHHLMQITEWDNGEGFDISYSTDKGNDKMYSLGINEIELLLKGLDLMGYFKFNKEEFKDL